MFSGSFSSWLALHFAPSPCCSISGGTLVHKSHPKGWFKQSTEVNRHWFGLVETKKILIEAEHPFVGTQSRLFATVTLCFLRLLAYFVLQLFSSPLLTAVSQSTQAGWLHPIICHQHHKTPNSASSLKHSLISSSPAPTRVCCSTGM